MQRIHNKTEKEIANEWDDISSEREKLIETGGDISFNNVTKPYILRSLDKLPKDYSVVDCGCGTGELSASISAKAKQVIGIDSSSKSIAIAKKKYRNISNLFLEKISIIEYAKENISSSRYCIANMVLMDVLDLRGNIEAINGILFNKGILILTITHPCYWPIYWEYFNKPWFDYDKEIIIEAPFTISKSDSLGISTHVHRPLDMYINMLIRCGFKIISLEELYPNNIIFNKNYSYKYPRFLGIKCKKMN